MGICAEEHDVFHLLKAASASHWACSFSNFLSQPSEMPTLRTFLQPHRTDTIGLSVGGIPANLRNVSTKQVYAPILSGKLLTLRHEITSAATRRASKREEDPGIAENPTLVSSQITLTRSQISSCRVAMRDRCSPGRVVSFQGEKIRVWAGAGTPRVDPAAWLAEGPGNIPKQGRRQVERDCSVAPLLSDELILLQCGGMSLVLNVVT